MIFNTLSCLIEKKHLASIVFIFISFNTNLAQTTNVKTEGDNSPAVVAKSFSVTYGVRTDAIEVILQIYKDKGYDSNSRAKATEQILREYSQTPEKLKKNQQLSKTSLQKIGVTNSPKIVNALEWDLFATNYYLSTSGYNSPAVVAKGNVTIWYGVSPKILRALAKELEQYKIDFINFETVIIEQVKKYKELKLELDTYKNKENIYKEADALLEQGKLDEAVQLIESDYYASKKRQAYKGYIFGKTKELTFNYEEASLGYQDAIEMDEKNVEYYLSYTRVEHKIARYDNAIKHYKIALKIDSLYNESKNKSVLFNNLAGSLEKKFEYDNALKYFEKALKIDLISLGEWHPSVASEYNNIGGIWTAKGNYDKALMYYKKTLKIDSTNFGINNPKISKIYNNIGVVWDFKGKYDKAIQYYNKSFKIDSINFGIHSPRIATVYNNLGLALKAKGDNTRQYPKAQEFYKKSIQYHKRALIINLLVHGNRHPKVSTNFNNLGTAFHAKEEYDSAIIYYKKAFKIDSINFGLRNPNIATIYNNLAGAYRLKKEYNKAIDLYKKSIGINLIFLPKKHPKIATTYRNLGKAYHSKGEYDKAINNYKKALATDSVNLGNKHIKTAFNYHNLGISYDSLKIYEKAIKSYEKEEKILSYHFDLRHPYRLDSNKNLIKTLYSNGMEFLDKKEYKKALLNLLKALEKSELLKDNTISLFCLNSIGAIYKHLKEYENGLFYINVGIEKSKQLKNNIVLIRMIYHKIGCLKGLGRKKKADEIAKELWKVLIQINDQRTLKDLKREGYKFKIN
ncbi:tetratricopeptide repeat protein [Kordia sp.]|uniref:tetratricopeptide repeat protein n=1 Tax=Kordia sp. TaxID=1965332 RepID=UPI003D2C114E